jgi:3-hydroxymyristoyl/3-hydroxydecanoyl-(acyl carrier protein) dehydratase
MVEPYLTRSRRGLDYSADAVSMQRPGAENTVSESLHIFPLCIPRTHPCLPGHFPGRPIVPGVVLLDHVLEGADRWLGRPCRARSLSAAKFTSPLLPEQHATVELTLAGSELSFVIRGASTVVAQGVFTLAMHA